MFLQYDERIGKLRIVILFTEWSLDILKNSKIWLISAAFKLKPPKISHLYVSRKLFQKSILLVYCLCCSKSSEIF